MSLYRKNRSSSAALWPMRGNWTWAFSNISACVRSTGANVNYIFPFREPRWVGFWLNRSPVRNVGPVALDPLPAQLAGQGVLGIEGRLRPHEVDASYPRFQNASMAHPPLKAVSIWPALARRCQAAAQSISASSPAMRTTRTSGKWSRTSLGRLKRREIFDRTFRR